MIMKKVLIVSNVITQITKFNLGNIDILQSMGYEVHVACNLNDANSCPKEMNELFQKQLLEKEVVLHNISFGRRIKGQILFAKPYKQLLELTNKFKFDFLHCHSMICGLCGRLVCKKNKIPCIYTAHGFTFFKGSSLFNWIFAYNEDKFLSRYTDCLITITKDDFDLARKHFKAKDVEYIHGVGVNVNKFSNSNSNSENIRKEFSLNNEYVIVSIGEINKNKNHIAAIKALEKSSIKNWKYIICGEGPQKNIISKYLYKKKIENRVIFAGYRNDVSDILNVANLYIHPSFREGLSVALMEAIASKTPVICSDIRGNNDLIENKSFRFNPKKVKDLQKCIDNAYLNYNDKDIENNFKTLLPFDSSKVDAEMKEIYKRFSHN